MNRLVCLIAVLAFVSVASASPVMLYSNDFDTTDGVTVRENDPNNPTTGPYLEDGGVWAHVPLDSTGYQIMDVTLIDLQAAEVIDASYGTMTITLQVEGDWMIEGEVQGMWLRVYSRKWDDGAGEYAFSGGRNFFVEVEQSSDVLGFGPGWQTFTIDMEDWNENDWIGPFDITQVYKFRIDSINWSADITPYRFGITYFDISVPECPYDLDGDDDIDLADLQTLLSNYGCQPHDAINVWNVAGFEGYSLGALPGQNGWVEDTTDPNDYGTVDVIDDPTGAGMGKVIDLTADDPIVSGWLGAGYEGLSVTADIVVIEFDQYRTGLEDNFYIADAIAFDGWWAMEWDSSQTVSSYYFDFGAALVANQWQHVMWVLDTVNDTATVIVDGGVPYSGETAMPDDVVNGIVFEFTPTEAGGVGESLYIDNVEIGTAPTLEYLMGCTFDQGDYDEDTDIDLADLQALLANYGCGAL